MPPGQLKRGLYLVEYDFTGVDAAARQIYKKDGADYVPLNPTGFFLASRTSITLKARAVAARRTLLRVCAVDHDHRGDHHDNRGTDRRLAGAHARGIDRRRSALP